MIIERRNARKRFEKPIISALYNRYKERMMLMAERSGVQSVERTFALLELMCKNGEMSVTELSVFSGLHKTTVCRLLSTLCNMGYVKQNERTGHYGVSLKFLKIGAGLLNNFDFRSYARQYFEKLSKNCGETVHLVCRDDDEIVYIDKFESDQSSVRMVSNIGLSLPMINTAVGKSILATLSDNEIAAVWRHSPHEQKTPHTIMSLEAFMNEIETVRKCGYAVDNEENELGVRCVGAALKGADGRYHYAFSVSAPVARMDGGSLKAKAELVLRTKAEIEGN